jgi:hypothetical protein
MIQIDGCLYDVFIDVTFFIIECFIVVKLRESKVAVFSTVKLSVEISGLLLILNPASFFAAR